MKVKIKKILGVTFLFISLSMKKEKIKKRTITFFNFYETTTSEP